MNARLRRLNADDSASIIALESLPVTLGRGVAADVRIADRCVSRVHCRIFEADNQIVVQDLGSLWGTLVNGQPVEKAALNPGDALTIGFSTFCVDRQCSERTSLLSRLATSLKRKLWLAFRVVGELLRDKPGNDR